MICHGLYTKVTPSAMSTYCYFHYSDICLVEKWVVSVSIIEPDNGTRHKKFYPSNAQLILHEKEHLFGK